MRNDPIWDEKPDVKESYSLGTYVGIYYPAYEMDIFHGKVQAYYKAIKDLLGADIVAIRTENRKLREKIQEWNSLHQKDRHTAPSILTDLEKMISEFKENNEK